MLRLDAIMNSHSNLDVNRNCNYYALHICGPGVLHEAHELRGQLQGSLRASYIQRFHSPPFTGEHRRECTQVGDSFLHRAFASYDLHFAGTSASPLRHERDLFPVVIS